MPSSKPPIAKAVRHFEVGDWQAAHTIVQKDSSALGCWAHGIVHLIEGDLANARYWYRRAHRTLPHADTAAAEIAALKDTLEKHMPKKDTVDPSTPEKSMLRKGTQ